MASDNLNKGERHLVFATDRQLQHLSVSRQWFMDGTFKIVKRQFHHLLTIHAFVRDGKDFKLVPLVFDIMSRRRTSDYVKIFKNILEALPKKPIVKTIILDFELAAWKGVRKSLPDIRIRGCLFHMTQTVWRKCQELGLQVGYIEDDDIHKFVRKLMALPFLPAADVTRLFNRISDRVPANGMLRQLTDYFESQWITHPMFTPRTWSVFNIAVRTNNFVEGWHRRMNNKLREQSLGVYRLVPELYQEAKLLPHQTNLIQEGPLKAYVRKTSLARQDEVFTPWNQFKNGDLSLSQLLTRCVAIHGPIH
ncbi:uncharacterized protein [Haliotis asinina]|uniref:uncharacterized protein n=1 Tax=Haliotis asinina TaxID=109174 RepID=UPI00353258E4